MLLFEQQIDLGEAVWSTGLPPSRSHHLALFVRALEAIIKSFEISFE